MLGALGSPGKGGAGMGGGGQGGGGKKDNIWRSDANIRSADAIPIDDSSDSSMPTTPKKTGILTQSSSKSGGRERKTETNNPSVAATTMSSRPRQIIVVGKVRVMHDDGTFADLLVCVSLHKADPGSKYGETINHFYDSHPVSMTEKLSSLMADDDTFNKPHGAPPTFVWLDKYAMTANGKGLGLGPRRDQIVVDWGFVWGF
ncbi:hypothetical protein LTR27_012211 [Elasticomyces elasticus]|nr:hypothetical protein LTR27_012211 [Elasticomyces elasticus]